MLWNFCLPRSYWQNFSLNRSLSVPGQKEKEKDGAQNNFPYSTGQGELWNASLGRQRDVFSSKIKKWGGGTWPAHKPTQIPAEALFTLIKKKMCEHCTAACIPCRISCVSQAHFKAILAIAIPHHERSPLLQRPPVNAIGRPRSDNSPFSNPGCVFWRYTLCRLRLIVL